MAFDRNPKSTPAEILIAGNTAEDVIRVVAQGASVTKLGRNTVAEPVKVDDLLYALVARYDRKAAARSEAA